MHGPNGIRVYWKVYLTPARQGILFSYCYELPQSPYCVLGKRLVPMYVSVTLINAYIHVRGQVPRMGSHIRKHKFEATHQGSTKFSSQQRGTSPTDQVTETSALSTPKHTRFHIRKPCIVRPEHFRFLTKFGRFVHRPVWPN